jgi:hypothetical protein
MAIHFLRSLGVAAAIALVPYLGVSGQTGEDRDATSLPSTRAV